jgi:PAS domain S-box-containing protein
MDTAGIGFRDHEGEDRFRGAFDFAAIGMALVSPTGRWLKVNRMLCEIVGYTEQELLKSDFQAITHAEDLDLDLNYVRQMLAQEIYHYEMEKRYIHKRGHLVHVLLSVSLVWGASGQPLYFISQVQDITRRKQIEQEREQLVQQLRQALAEIKNLTGLLPICYECKKIRDDKGYWSQVESYIQQHTNARFSHGLCPDCGQKALAEIDQIDSVNRDPGL